MKSFKTPKGTELPILELRGKDYLQVAHRLVWFREEKPGWSIITEFIECTDKRATAKATIIDESGRVISTAHKTEDIQGFQDYKEKAETGAIGRALAHTGYGTQFAPELDEHSRIVDAPINRPKQGAQTNAPKTTATQRQAARPNSTKVYTIPFGKFNGKTLSEVGPGQLLHYIEFIQNESAKKKEPIPPMVGDFIARAEEFIKAQHVAKAKDVREEQVSGAAH